MNRAKYSLSPQVLALGVLVFALTGCQSAPVQTADLMKSPAGVNIEAMFPVDSTVIVKLGSKDKSQLDSLKTLGGYFPNDPWAEVVKNFNQGFKEGAKFEETGLEYERDILPLISEKTEMYVAVSAPKSKEAEPVVLMAMTLADQSKLDEILKKQVEKGVIVKKNENGLDYYTDKDEAITAKSYAGRAGDVAFMTNNVALLTQIGQAASNQPARITENKVYARAKAQFKPGLAFAYIDVSNVFEALKNLSDRDSEQLASLMSTPGVYGDAVKALESEVLSLQAEKDGLRLSWLVLAKDGTDFQKISGADLNEPAYLMSKIPANSPLFYAEGYNLKKSFEIMMQILSSQKNEVNYEEGVQQMKMGLLAEGLDLDKDILSFMDKGYAFLWDDSGFWPSLGFYIDASSNVDGAVKVSAKLNNLMDQGLGELVRENPEAATMVNKEEVIKGQMWKVSLNLDKALAQAPAPVAKKLSGQRLELYYGVNADKVMVIALSPDVNDQWGKDKVVAKTDEFKKALSMVGGKSIGVTYFSPAYVAVWSERLMNFVQESGSRSVDMKEFNQVIRYVLPVKSMIMVAGEKGKDMFTMEAFVHIAK